MIIRDNFCQFCTKTYVVTPHLNRLFKTVSMRNKIPLQVTLHKLKIQHDCAIFEVVVPRSDVSKAQICTVKILKIGTPEIITIIVLHLERLDFTVQYCVQKMQTEYQTE